MNLDLLTTLTERLRAESIRDPKWVQATNVFEYPDQNVEIAVVLKLVRAAQGIHSMNILCRCGLFVDMGAIYRCVADCVAEVYFLLEEYPSRSSNVAKFLREFFSHTIDEDLSSGENSVRSKKIHSAMIRSITGRDQDDRLQKCVTNVYRTYSGYVHAGYAHIMEMYGGPDSHLSFNISGIQSRQQQEIRMETIGEAYRFVLYAIAHAAGKFGLKQLFRDGMAAANKGFNPTDRA